MSAQTSCGVCSFSCCSVSPWFSFHVCVLSVHCFVPGRRWHGLVSLFVRAPANHDSVVLQNMCLHFTTCFSWQTDALYDSGSLLERWLFRGVAAPDHRFSARLSAGCAVENLHAVVADCDFYFSSEHQLAALGIVIPWYKKMRSKAFVRRLPLRRAGGRRFRGTGLRLVWESITRSRNRSSSSY